MIARQIVPTTTWTSLADYITALDPRTKFQAITVVPSGANLISIGGQGGGILLPGVNTQYRFPMVTLKDVWVSGNGAATLKIWLVL
jgi:hypothetical protein